MALVAASALAAYLPSLANGFTNWDDEAYVVYNGVIRDLSAAGIWKMLTTLQVMGNYHPLTLLSYALEYAAAGAAPAVYHATNLLLHLGTTLLVYRFIRLIDERPAVAALGALLFGIHPLHVESVAWISARKDLLYGFFYVAAMIAYVRAGDRARGRWYWIAVGCGALSLAAKGVAVSLPVTLVAIDLLRGTPLNGRSFMRKIPFAALAVAGGIVAIAAQRSSSSVLDLGTYTAVERGALVAHALFTYLWKSVLPLHLSAVYPYPDAGDIGWGYAAAAAAIACGAVWLAVAGRQSRRARFAALMFLGTLAPVLQVLPVGRAVMAERYMYIPLLPLCYALAAWLAPWISQERAGRRWTGAVRVAAAAYCCMLAVLTWQRCGVWASSESLWSDVLAQFPRSQDALAGRAGARFAQGDYAAAEADYDRLLGVNPGHPEGHLGRGNTMVRLGRYNEALGEFTAAVALDPRSPLAFYNRGCVQAQIGHDEAAIEDFSRALRILPTYGEAYVNRGVVELRLGHRQEACRDFRSAMLLGTPTAAELVRDQCAGP